VLIGNIQLIPNVRKFTKIIKMLVLYHMHFNLWGNTAHNTCFPFLVRYLITVAIKSFSSMPNYVTKYRISLFEKWRTLTHSLPVTSSYYHRNISPFFPTDITELIVGGGGEICFDEYSLYIFYIYMIGAFLLLIENSCGILLQDCRP
jgi:hypothetical protein